VKAAPLPGQMCTTFCCCWPCGVVGDAPASSKRSGKSTGLTKTPAVAWAAEGSPGPRAVGTGCTRRRDNTHKIEEREVLYPWHPWFGRVVHVRKMIEKRAGGILHCSLDGSASAHWLELPKWMFDRAASLSMRMEVSPRVDSAALTALKTCLVDASGAGLCGSPLSNASDSGAGKSSYNQNRRAAHATQAPPSTQP
jgi:hypothetical protein